MDYEEFDNAESFEHLFMAEPENAESIVQFDAEDYEENQENPNQETPTGFPKLQGRLRDWYHSLGEYRQLQIQRSISLEAFMKSLRNKAYRASEAKNVTIAQTTLGELYQLILNALAKLCNQKKFIAEFERTGKRLGTACDDKYLQIKCKDKSSCDCTHTKKKFHSKRFLGLSGKPRFSRQSNKKWKFVRKKKKRGKTSDRCFICQKRGHFARNCPDKKRSQALIQALNKVEPVDVSDLESLYSLDDEPSNSVLCTIAYSDLSSDDDSDTKSGSDFRVHMINPIPHVLSIQEDPPLPLAKIHLLTDAYAKPIPVISFFDTVESNVVWFKNAPSAFQKAMITIFEPILTNTLVYIDDILLFSPDEQSHAELLSKFYSLVTKYEIMLSEKKMEVGVTTIQFHDPVPWHGNF
nr:putative zinc finger, CCHC-type [Tanacetum cinerariifolium]